LFNFSLDLQEKAENSSISVLTLWAAKMRALWSLLAFKGAILNAQLLLLLLLLLFYNIDIKANFNQTFT